MVATPRAPTGHLRPAVAPGAQPPPVATAVGSRPINSVARTTSSTPRSERPGRSAPAEQAARKDELPARAGAGATTAAAGEAAGGITTPAMTMVPTRVT